MAFLKKIWKNRIAEYPTRRRLTKTDGSTEIVTVSREEGTISQEGDAFSAENMNDLEKRIEDEFSNVNNSLGDFLRIVQATNPNSATVPANGVANVGITYAVPSGYKAIGVVGYYTGNANCFPYRIRLQNNAIYLKNTSSAQATVNANDATVDILCVKTI